MGKETVFIGYRNVIGHIGMKTVRSRRSEVGLGPTINERRCFIHASLNRLPVVYGLHNFLSKQKNAFIHRLLKSIYKEIHFWTYC